MLEPPVMVYAKASGVVCHVSATCAGGQLVLPLARADVRRRMCRRCRGGGTVAAAARPRRVVAALDRPALAAATPPGEADASETAAAQGVVVLLATHRSHRHPMGDHGATATV